MRIIWFSKMRKIFIFTLQIAMIGVVVCSSAYGEGLVFSTPVDPPPYLSPSEVKVRIVNNSHRYAVRAIHKCHRLSPVRVRCNVDLRLKDGGYRGYIADVRPFHTTWETS